MKFDIIKKEPLPDDANNKGKASSVSLPLPTVVEKPAAANHFDVFASVDDGDDDSFDEVGIDMLEHSQT